MFIHYIRVCNVFTYLTITFVDAFVHYSIPAFIYMNIWQWHPWFGAHIHFLFTYLTIFFHIWPSVQHLFLWIIPYYHLCLWINNHEQNWDIIHICLYVWPSRHTSIHLYEDLTTRTMIWSPHTLFVYIFDHHSIPTFVSMGTITSKTKTLYIFFCMFSHLSILLLTHSSTI